ncbi:flagellar type III secretion system protein FlhB [Yoonia sp.]|uniref:flagellar type III secretion system protein FlhB n=1 Tax=Yoonia sp. TaxID=2212373 RepID=UPI0019F5A07E|nr:flagellar type III secretion system protein FlhB [Yoonia sp.]MBE0413787.1 flagellar biosynthesis protein FlhB [Yoonia sp.]
MSADEDDNEKQFEPTQKKLDNARAKGEIAKSNDLTTAAAYAGFFVVATALGAGLLSRLGANLSILLAQPVELGQLIFAGGGRPIAVGVMSQVLINLAPWFALPAILSVLSVIVQRAFVVAPSKLQPKLNRISPLSGFKNKFGRQGLFEFVKSMTKLLIYGVILGFFMLAQADRIIGSMKLETGLIVAELGRMLLQMMALVCMVALVLGAGDYLWQKAEHIRKNRMSRKEFLEELKQAEGDPVMKQKRRQKGQEIAMNKMLADVPKADVIIVNPTHFAVALRWNKMAGGAPVCVAKGVDEIAATIREIAHENGVPLHADPPTARALYATVQIGQEISPDHYRAVAVAIRFAETIRKKARQR